MANSEINNLEDQVRNMILRSTTLPEGRSASGTSSHESGNQRGQGRGRGRGRGGHHRAQEPRPSEEPTPGTPRNRAFKDSVPRDVVPSPSTPRGGRGGSRRRNSPGPHANINHNTAPGRSQINEQSAAGSDSPFAQVPHDGPVSGSGMEKSFPSGTGNDRNQPLRMLKRPTNAPTPPHTTTRVTRPPGSFVQPAQRHPYNVPENPIAQINYLEYLASQEIPKAEIPPDELGEKENFRKELESILQKALAENYSGGDIASINLIGFGSLASGFATAGSDVDLALVPTWKDPNRSPRNIALEIPRLLEKAVLDAHMGGRLLTRTRVPILKVCQLPTEQLAQALLEERKKWDDLPEDEKYAPPPSSSEKTTQTVGVESLEPQLALTSDEFPSLAEARKEVKKTPSEASKSEQGANTVKSPADGKSKEGRQSRVNKPFKREKPLGPLDFPKTGVGIQCDINFENPLGIHNTRLLRFYSLCDPRVRLMVLFVKSWAKRRKINSSYAGTLSSYGWVLMVLHYLVNVAQPPVCPNLQAMWRPPPNLTAESLHMMFQETTVAGCNVRFYDNEPEIIRASQAGVLTQNTQSLGALLRGFFRYYSSPHPSAFYWTNAVLSLRTPGGILTKVDKGWTGAKTTVLNGKEVRNRYLFCIEDPFEVDHNVARTVTHFGIVAIRDEFRRAWRILSSIGRGQEPEGGLFDEIVEPDSPSPEDKAGNDSATGAEHADESHPDGTAVPVAADDTVV